jgi:hypothetical protein
LAAELAARFSSNHAVLNYSVSVVMACEFVDQINMALNRAQIIVAFWVMLVFASGITCVGGPEAGLDHLLPPATVMAKLGATTNIVFEDKPTVFNTNAWRQFTVTDTKVLRQLIGAIQLYPKAPCRCGHRYQAIFNSPTGAVGVSFCDHCFDAAAQNEMWFCIMPQRFYQEFKTLAQAGNWNVKAEKP